MNPISLHPDNPHYFLFRGEPAVLITSGEHYGAVLNLDFDYGRYLNEIHARGFNLTRTFSGFYREVPASFGIENNTLAPAPGSFICPWARSSTPGAADGGSKFDLQRWDQAYFHRLKDFLSRAGERGIVVELVLFCALYEDVLWEINPLNSHNNINGVGDVPRSQAYDVQNKPLLAAQEAMVRKLIQELDSFGNVYFEVMNEPYITGVSRQWEDQIISTILDAEAHLPTRRLIAQNIANGSRKVVDANPATSIFNFHYASPPDSVTVNYHLDRPIAFDETGFQGTADLPYRRDAWAFLMAGGASYSHLDYSFTPAHPDGTASFSKSPGGGGPTIRRQLQVLKEFMERFHFIRMKPDQSILRTVSHGITAYALAEPGKAYAIYLKGSSLKEDSLKENEVKDGSSGVLQLDVPAGRYRATWIHPENGDAAGSHQVDHPGGLLALSAPPYNEDIALELVSGLANQVGG